MSFSIKKKPHERIDLLITASEHLPDKKNPIVMKTCFSEGKLMKQFGNPPLSKRTPPFQLTPHPLFLSNFFMTPVFVQILKTRTHPAPLILRGGGNYAFTWLGNKNSFLESHLLISRQCSISINPENVGKPTNFR